MHTELLVLDAWTCLQAAAGACSQPSHSSSEMPPTQLAAAEPSQLCGAGNDNAGSHNSGSQDLGDWNEASGVEVCKLRSQPVSCCAVEFSLLCLAALCASYEQQAQ